MSGTLKDTLFACSFFGEGGGVVFYIPVEERVHLSSTYLWCCIDTCMFFSALSLQEIFHDCIRSVLLLSVLH